MESQRSERKGRVSAVKSDNRKRMPLSRVGQLKRATPTQKETFSFSPMSALFIAKYHIQSDRC